MNQHINRIPALRLLISSSPGLASRMHVESLGKSHSSTKLCLVNLTSKDTSLVHSLAFSSSQLKNSIKTVYKFIFYLNINKTVHCYHFEEKSKKINDDSVVSVFHTWIEFCQLF